jgi:hypothetical protein
MNIINFIKSHKVLSIIVFFIFLSILIFLFGIKTNQTKITQPSPTPGTANWSGIIPGKSSEVDVNKIFGNPISTKGGVSDYKSSSDTQNNKVVYQNGKVIFMKHIITNADNPSTTVITDEFGAAPVQLYGPEASAGIYLFVYPDKGIAYMGNPDKQFLFEIWYFQPMSINDFISKWAPNYSTTQNSQGF